MRVPGPVSMRMRFSSSRSTGERTPLSKTGKGRLDSSCVKRLVAMVALAQINPPEKSSVAPYIERESNGVRNRVHLVGAQRGDPITKARQRDSMDLVAVHHTRTRHPISRPQ